MGLHCVAHKLELAAHDATKSYKYLEQMESTIKGIFSFYHYSPRRKNEVKAIAEILDVDFAHMSDIKQVRLMSSKSRAVSALEQNLKAVAGHLEHNSLFYIVNSQIQKFMNILILGEINTWQDTSKAKVSKLVFIFLIQVRKHCHEFTWFLFQCFQLHDSIFN
jgi:hypothetical protein